jgi:capsid assembly protease
MLGAAPALCDRGAAMSKGFLPLLADRVLNRPLLIHPGKAETIFAVLEGRITLGDVAEAEAQAPAPDASRFKGGYRKPNGEATRFTRISGDTALISVTGSLVNRGAWVGASSGLTSYEGIGAQIDEVAADSDIQHVVFDIDSYGGEATGMSALASKIVAMRRKKYVVAVVNDVAASAGYGIASAADEIVVSQTSVVGSIGVVMMHVDRSREMEAKGLKPTLIHAGAKKVDGHPFGPLPDNVRADMERDVMAFYAQFLATVEAGRGKRRLSAEKARATEADTFIGEEAIRLGLADRMGSIDDVLAELSRPSRAAGQRRKGGSSMDRNDLPGMSAGDVSETALKAARIEGEASGKTVGKAEGIEEGKALGAQAERDRIGAILNSDEAKARPNAALKLALDAAQFSAETAKGVLAGLPEEKAPAAEAPPPSTPPLSQRGTGPEMGAQGNPEAGGIDADAAKGAWANVVTRMNARR